MRFWEDLFAEAMKVLTTESEEPKPLTESGGGIRSARGWEQVCSRLNEAQITYAGEEGTSGMLKRMRRKVADNLRQPAAHVTKMVPDVKPWVTSVVGTIDLLLQAVSTAAKTRQEILTNLADLEKTFSDINSFAATFPQNDNVRQASITLVVAIFQTVEQAIAFFVKSSGELTRWDVGIRWWTDWDKLGTSPRPKGRSSYSHWYRISERAAKQFRRSSEAE